MTTSFNVNINDLQFILRQIKIGEASSEAYDATPKTILQAIMDEYGVTAVNAQQLPAGLRTVDGSFNSLLPGQENLGAADMVFPRLLDPVFIDAGTPAGTIPGVTNTNYGVAGNVVELGPAHDLKPRRRHDGRQSGGGDGGLAALGVQRDHHAEPGRRARGCHCGGTGCGCREFGSRLGSGSEGGCG